MNMDWLTELIKAKAEIIPLWAAENRSVALSAMTACVIAGILAIVFGGKKERFTGVLLVLSGGVSLGFVALDATEAYITAGEVLGYLMVGVSSIILVAMALYWCWLSRPARWRH